MSVTTYTINTAAATAPTSPRPTSLFTPAAFFVGDGDAVAVAETDDTIAAMVLDAAATSVVGGSACHLSQSSPSVFPESLGVSVVHIHNSQVLQIDISVHSGGSK
jgi:hypothetical protein